MTRRDEEGFLHFHLWESNCLRKSLSKSKNNQLNQEEDDYDIKEEEEIEDSKSIDDDDDYDDNNLQGDELSQSDSGGESDVDDDMVKTSQE